MPARLLALICGLSLLACTTAAVATNPETLQEPASAPPPESSVIPAGSVPIQVREDVQVQTYVVRGRTAAELRTELSRSGPFSIADGRRFDALTSWSLRWSFRYERDGPSCRLAAAAVDFDVVVTLPELEDAGLLAPRTLDQWSTYRQALEDHETGHIERQREGVQALQSALSSYEDDWPSCRELGQALNAEGLAQITAMHAEDRRYDEETGHGRTQGAVFP